MAAAQQEHSATAATPPPFQLIGVPFVKDGDRLDGGDFTVMIQQEQYADALFVFNGNVEDDMALPPSRGGGSAVIRPYMTNEAGMRAASIPTGWSTGIAFADIDDQTKMVIDLALERICTVVHVRKYQRVLFPCDPDDTTCIGTAIFSLPPRVLKHINSGLQSLRRRYTVRVRENLLMNLVHIRYMHRFVKGRIESETQKLRTQRARALETDPFKRHGGALVAPVGLYKRTRDAIGSSSSDPSPMLKFLKR